jgi:putative DNA primase/helicase
MSVVVKKKLYAAQSATDDQPGAVITFPAAMADAAVPPQYSDDALALRFAERHADDLRYVAELDQWFHFDGKRWHGDKTLMSVLRAREVCRLAAAACGNMPIGTKLASSATVYAVHRLARADKRMAAAADQWDADPFLLNTPDYLIDLRTGEPRVRTPLNYCTKMTAVSPGGSCPVWLQFLATIFAGNDETMGYVQRLAGYALTGSTEEHAMFFCFGTDANGKSTLLNTLAGVMGDYSAVASMDTFTASHNDRHPTELAVLRGARMVTASETEEGRRWAEAKIKAIVRRQII